MLVFLGRNIWIYFTITLSHSEAGAKNPCIFSKNKLKTEKNRKKRQKYTESLL